MTTPEPRKLDCAKIGATLQLQHAYTWRDVVLYALAVGAGADDLDYVYEARGPRVLPSYAVVPAFHAVYALHAKLADDLSDGVHLRQSLVLHEPIPPSGTLTTTGVLAAIYDHGAMASTVIDTQTRDPAGRLLFTTQWTVGFLRHGGWGGERPPRRVHARPPQRLPDHESSELVSQRAAAFYRLTGDENPLHIDPALARDLDLPRPIVHGSCTLGHVCRALLRAHAGELRELSLSFRRPVFPGDQLQVASWVTPERIVLQARARSPEGGTDALVVDHAYAVMG